MSKSPAASRSKAVELGLVRYFNGEPCPHGHVAERYTLSGFCGVCQKLATRAQKAAAKARRRSA